MSLSVLVLVYENRALLPAASLASTMIPFASLAIVNGALSWILPHKFCCYIDNQLYKTFMRSCSFVFENCNAAKINLYGDITELRTKSDNSIVISNHQSDADWAILNMLTARHSLNGKQDALRFVVKRIIHYVPLYGWYTLQRGFVYVDRFGGFKPTPVIKQLEYLSTCRPFWLTIFPEGTRFNAKKTGLISQGKEYCRRRELEKLRHLFPPKSGAFHLSLNELNSALDCVYDITIGYSQTRLPSRMHDAPNMFEFVTGQGDRYNEVHVHVRRLPISGIPTNQNDIKTWLHSRFVEKDELMDIFYKTGVFPTPVEIPTSLGSLSTNFTAFLIMNGAVWSALFFPRVRQVYTATIAISPLLLIWSHFRDFI